MGLNLRPAVVSVPPIYAQIAGSWETPMVFVASTGIVAALAGLAAVRPVYIEDDVA